MKRTDYLVSVYADGVEMPLHEETRYAMNSGVRASEAAVRAAARAAGVMFTGDPPVRVGGTYTRTWRAPDGAVLRAKVERQ
jgi:hypothetical protein